MKIHDARDEDRPFVTEVVTREFGATRISSRGVIFDVLTLPTLVATVEDERLGLAIYRFEKFECELVVLVATDEGRGVGSMLIDHVRDRASDRGCERLFLTTSNDNTDALRFYQRRGFRLCRLYPGSLEDARRQIPTMPEIGHHNIPIRDDIELEIRLV